MGPKSMWDHVVISVLTSAHSKLLVASLISSIMVPLLFSTITNDISNRTDCTIKRFPDRKTNWGRIVDTLEGGASGQKQAQETD